MKKFIVVGAMVLYLLMDSVYAQVLHEKKVIASSNFSLQDESVKRGTRGVDFDKLFASIIKSKPPVKSEYETKDEFDLRRIDWEKSRFHLNIGTDNLIAFSFSAAILELKNPRSGVRIDYDAETEVMTVEIQSTYGCGGVLLKQETKSTGTYLATNGYGAKVEVLVADEKRNCVVFGEGGRLSSANQKVMFKVERRLAESTKILMEIFVIGRVSYPGATEEYSRRAPTMRFPVEKKISTRAIALNVESVWLVHGNGVILAKIEK
jgi:hypothetical protein